MYTISVTEVSPKEEKNTSPLLSSESAAQDLLDELYSSKENRDNYRIFKTLVMAFMVVVTTILVCLAINVARDIHKVSVKFSDNQRMSEK